MKDEWERVKGREAVRPRFRKKYASAIKIPMGMAFGLKRGWWIVAAGRQHSMSSFVAFMH